MIESEICRIFATDISKIQHMILSEFTYKDISGWQLEKLSFNLLNLIVGKNAVGKSRTIEAIGNVIRFIKGELETEVLDFSCSLQLKDGYTLQYSFDVKGGQVISEELKRDDRWMIRRTQSQTIMLGDEINPPMNRLVIQARRDTKKYPEIEEIIQWAEQTFVFVFSNITTSPNSLSPYAISNEPLISSMYEKISEERQNTLIAYMKELGYRIDRVEEYERPSGAKWLHIHEIGIERPLTQFDLSNGMFRAFCVLLYMIYSSTLSKARCLMIDDLGEGLDYMRSTKLGEIMFSYCQENQIQLIVTSNDSFLMDSIDLAHWNILQREGNHVHGLNSITHTQLFEKFARTGLSNFDMLSSNFIANNTAQP